MFVFNKSMWIGMNSLIASSDASELTALDRQSVQNETSLYLHELNEIDLL